MRELRRDPALHQLRTQPMTEEILAELEDERIMEEVQQRPVTAGTNLRVVVRKVMATWDAEACVRFLQCRGYTEEQIIEIIKK